jgi:hypothetical protein
MAQHHRLGGGGGFVEHRGVGNFQPGQVANHRLEVEQHFQATLRDLGLVGRVLGIPAGVFENIPLNDRRRDGVVVAETDERTENLILARDGAQFRQRFEFGNGRGQVQRLGQPDGGRHGGIRECIQAREAERAKHGGQFSGAGADVAADKRVGLGNGGHGDN